MIETPTIITLDKCQLRWYQEPIWDAIENAGYRKVLAVMPRRCGKDYTAWNLCIRQAITRVCLGYYVLPTYGQARKVIWDAISSDGIKFLDMVPSEVVEAINHSDMKIRFKNGSILQCIGGDSYDTSLVGTNPYYIVFSEYSRMTPKAYEFARPILAANGGWCIMASTPFGKNHMYTLHKVVEDLDDWYVLHMKTSEIKHIPEDILDQERAQMSEGMYQQEYECSYERGIDGAIYGKNLENLRQAGQICPVAWDPGLLTHLATDIGVNDATTIIWFQVVGDGTIIRIIDCYSNTGLGLDHYAKIIQDKPYRYGKFFAPHDIAVREWGGGAVTRYEKAKQLGIDFVTLDQISVMDGIENVWTHFPKFWIDESRCKSLINALENYRREWDEERQIYKDKPIHNWASNYADALRYLCMSLHKTKRGMTSEEFDRKRAEALYGNNQMLPPFFRR